MKKLIILCCLFIATSSAFCQVIKSGWMLNGEIGYQNLKEDGESESMSLLTFNPKMGYLVSNSVMLGADFNILSLKSGDATYTQSLIGPFVRFYGKGTEGSKVLVFGEGGYSFGSDKSKYQSDTDKDNKYAWTLGAGLAAFLGDKVSIEPMIRYQSITTKYEATQFSQSSEYKVGSLEILVGLSIYLFPEK